MELFMDKTEIGIADIRDAVLIKIYIMPNGIMGLLMIYAEDSMINLSADDRYFPQLEQAAVRCYIADRDAAADSFTREILEKRSISGMYPWAERFAGCTGSRLHEGMYEKDVVKTYMPLLSSYLGMIFGRLGISTEGEYELTGYRTRYIITVKGTHTDKQMPLLYTPLTDGGSFTVGNISAPQDCMKITVRFSFGSADISADLDSSRYIGIRDHYDLIGRTRSLRMFDEDEPIFDRTDALDSVRAESIPDDILLNNGFDDQIRLPWCRVLTGSGDRHTVCAVIQAADDTKIIHEFSREYLSDDRRIVTDSINAVHEVFPHEGKRRICTHFLPTQAFSAGRYKSFADRYFCRDTEPEV